MSGETFFFKDPLQGKRSHPDVNSRLQRILQGPDELFFLPWPDKRME
jgi:hypothetical protein